MLSLLLLQVGLGSIWLGLRRAWTARNLLWFLLGSGLGMFVSFFGLASLAMSHPITSDPGLDGLNAMRYSFLGLVLVCGVLGGMLSVRLAARGSAAEEAAGTGLSPGESAGK
ncbi:MAG: hypothetical protein U0931_25090 [Vulcanimicrobiota bacterium]